MRLRRISTLFLLALVILPSLAIYGLSSGLADRVSELFESQRYGELIDELSGMPAEALSPAERFTLLASQLRAAKLRGDQPAAREAATALDRFAESADPDWVARVDAERIAAMGLTGMDRAFERLDAALRHWEEHEDLPLARAEYLQLMEVLLQEDVYLQAPFLRMWRNLVRAEEPREDLLRIGEKLLGSGRQLQRPWQILSRAGDGDALLRQVASDVLQWQAPPWTVAVAELRLGELAEQQQHLVEAVKHFEAAVAALPATDSAAAAQARDRLERLRQATIEIAGAPLHRPGSSPVLRLDYRNLRGFRVELRRLDPTLDLSLSDPRDARTGVASWYRTASGSRVFERNFDVSDSRAYSSYQRDVAVGELPPGLYLCEALGEASDASREAPRASFVLQITKLGLFVQPLAGTGAGAMDCWLVDMQSGMPQPGVALQMRFTTDVGDQAHWQSRSLRTDEEGRVRVGDLPERLRGLVIAGEHVEQPVLMVDGGVMTTRVRQTSEVRTQVLTDRTLYRPGEIVHFSAVLRLRDLERRELRAPNAGRPVQLIAVAADGKEFHRSTLQLDDEGFVETEWRLPSDVALGVAQIQMRFDDERSPFHIESLRIEQVRLPEFRVRVVRTDDGALVAGDSLHVEVLAEYLWGGPVRGSAELVVTRRPRWYWPPMPVPLYGKVESSFQLDYGMRPQFGGGEEIARTTLPLDGSLHWAFASRAEEGMFDYVVSARVVDESRREESGSANFAVGQSEFVASLSASRWCVQPGDEVQLRLRIEDLERRGQRRSGELSIHHTTEDEKLVETRHVQSDAEGNATVRFRPSSPGHYRFEFHGEDSRGNQVRAECAIYATDPEQRLIVQASGGLTLVAERDQFDGDQARILLLSETPDQWVYLARAHGAGVETELVQLKGNGKLLTIPLDPMHRPRFHLRALAARDYRVQYAELTVEAPAPDKRLDVQLSFDSERYRPGDLARLRIQAQDGRGRPSRAPFRVAVIDAALLEVVPRQLVDPVALFHDFWTAPAPRTLISAERFGGYWQGEPEEEKERANGGRRDGLGQVEMQRDMMVNDAPASAALESRMAKSEADEVMAPLELRTDFRSTALWRSLVRPDADGVAELEVPLPESLTEWNALALGVDRESRAGMAETTTQTKKDLQVRLARPRIFRERDRMLLTAIVHNESAQDLNATVRLHASPLQLDRGDQLVHVPAAGSATVSWWAEIDAKAAALRLVRDEDSGRLSVWPERCRVRVEALSSLESDGFEQMVDLYPYGTPVRVTAAGRYTQNATLKFRLPTDRVPATERASLSLSPSALSACIDALPYLASYPYGCVEQTLSRFIPAVAVRQAARSLGVNSRRIDPELDAKIQRGIDRLDELQRPDGAFGWWVQGEGDPYMTAYAILALEQAAAAGIGVPASKLSSARVALRNMLPKLESRPDDLAYALLALAKMPEDDTIVRHAQRLVDERDQLNDATRALLALHEIARERIENAGLLLSTLRTTGIHEESLDTVHWGESRNYWWRWQGAVEVTSFALRAWLAVEPEAPEVDQAAQWLLAQRSGARWKSTRETAHAIFALTRYAAQRSELSADFEVIAMSGEHELARMRVTPADLLDAGGSFVLDPSLFADGDNELSLRFEGTGTCYASISVDGFTSQDRPEPTSYQIAVRRELLRLEPAMTLGGSIRHHERPFADGDSLLGNERLRVRLHLTAAVDLEYVAIEDPRPSGFEPVEQLSGWQGAGTLWLRREAAEDRTAFFVGFIPQGEHVIEYDLRAETPGRFHAMPTLAYAMYVPQISASSELQELLVVENSKEPTPKP